MKNEYSWIGRVGLIAFILTAISCVTYEYSSHEKILVGLALTTFGVLFVVFGSDR